MFTPESSRAAGCWGSCPFKLLTPPGIETLQLAWAVCSSDLANHVRNEYGEYLLLSLLGKLRWVSKTGNLLNTRTDTFIQHPCTRVPVQQDCPWTAHLAAKVPWVAFTDSFTLTLFCEEGNCIKRIFSSLCSPSNLFPHFYFCVRIFTFHVKQAFVIWVLRLLLHFRRYKQILASKSLNANKST